MGGFRAPGRATLPSPGSPWKCLPAWPVGTQAGIQPLGVGAGREGGNEMVEQKHPWWTDRGESPRRCWPRGEAVSLLSLVCALGLVCLCACVCVCVRDRQRWVSRVGCCTQLMSMSP